MACLNDVTLLYFLTVMLQRRGKWFVAIVKKKSYLQAIQLISKT